MKKLSAYLRRINLQRVVFKKNFSNAETAKTDQVSPLEEWNKVYAEKMKAQMDHLTKELSEYERKEVEALVSRITQLSKEEKAYYTHLAARKVSFILGEDISQVKLNPAELMSEQNTWPKNKENWLKTPSMMATYASFTGGSVAGKYSFK